MLSLESRYTLSILFTPSLGRKGVAPNVLKTNVVRVSPHHKHGQKLIFLMTTCAGIYISTWFSSCQGLCYKLRITAKHMKTGCQLPCDSDSSWRPGASLEHGIACGGFNLLLYFLMWQRIISLVLIGMYASLHSSTHTSSLQPLHLHLSFIPSHHPLTTIKTFALHGKQICHN